MPELLLEILSEEIPARMQAHAAHSLKHEFFSAFLNYGIYFSEEQIQSYVTPRRLILTAADLPDRQPDSVSERKGPRVGAPAEALHGFVRACGLASLSEAEVRKTEKGDFYFYAQKSKGRSTEEIISEILFGVLINFRWPKSMRWGAGSVRWVRPIQNILGIFDGEPLSFDFSLGAYPPEVLVANSRTRGHRFLAPAEFTVTNFADYRDKLLAAKVMLDPAERRRLILAKAEALAASEGLRLRADEALLDEVTGLVEWPAPMLGSIDPRFMDVPSEVLVTAMRAHQKYFSLLDAAGKLAPRFVLVANTETADGGRAIVAGNERVLRARLSDAKFFWDEDRKRTLESRVEKLKYRVFKAKLGSDLDRARRLPKLARTISRYTNADPELAERAGLLCKADLTTAMVGEFPELQGVMGRYYALHDEENLEVADAIADHYAPQGPHDRCPSASVSVTVALADKIDTLVGLFAIGEKPSGSKDPYGLRRAALGAIRLIVENGVRVSLLKLFDATHKGFKGDILDNLPLEYFLPGQPRSDLRKETVLKDLLAFFADRLKVHLREQGVRHDLIAAVFAAGGESGAEDDIVRLLARVDALRAFLDTDDGANLLTAYRRASNIVRIEENKDNRRYQGEAEEALLAEKEELELHRALSSARSRIGQALNGEQFEEAMTILAALRAPVDAFFDHVKVNCANADLRVNRLKLLSQIRSALGGVADFSQIEG
ncbi:MAG: glycine--tRNA ligase subunit beta [Rhodospirillales bacterium]